MLNEIILTIAVLLFLSIFVFAIYKIKDLKLTNKHS